MIKIRIIISAILLSLIYPASAEHWSIIHAGKLMAIPGKPITTSQSIIIREGSIVEIRSGYVAANALTIGNTDTVTVHNLKNSFVLPGLIDSHVHVTGELGPSTKLDIVERSDADTAMFGARNAKILLQAGFTTIRDLGSRGDDAIFALRDAINSGYIPGPRILAAGHTISPTGGHGQRHGYRENIFQTMHSSGVCDGVAGCRKAVRDQVRQSADQIKLVSTGGVLSETAAGTGQQFFDDELKAIVDTSHALGRKVTAHAHGTNGINAALRAGVDSIEHGTFSTNETFKLFKETGAYLIPTLLAGITVTEIASKRISFFPDSIKSKALKVGPNMINMVKKAHKKGVKIAFGTDSYVSKHGVNAREFELLVEAGLSPTEAIISATVNGADNIGKSSSLGTIENGKHADIIAVETNPINNIKTLANVKFVMKAGKVYKHQTQDQTQK